MSINTNLVGETIQGRYYVEKQLGRGGLGVTFLARDRQCFDSQCVVKQLKPKTTDPRTLAIARRLFNREAEIVNRLGHCDRIPRLLAYFEHDQDFFLVQELIEGHDLSHEIIAGQPWSESKTIDLLREVLDVLTIVQQHNVIHRDLKPSNLMRRCQDGNIILIDFGSVKQISTQIIDAAGQVKQTVAVGTKSYMPTEQMEGRPGFYSDIYALGVIAIQALTGIMPRKLPVNREGEIIWRDRLDRRVNYQPGLLKILDKMVRYRYRERYASAAMVLSDLARLDAAVNNSRNTVLVTRSQAKSFPQSPPQFDVEREPLVVSQPMPTVAPEKKPLPPISERSPQPIPKTPHPQPVTKFKSAKVPLATATIILSLAALSGWLFLGRDTSEPEERSLYRDSALGFRVNYPQTWSEEQRDDLFAEGVVFLSPLEDEQDRFMERVNISVEMLPQDASLTQYTQQSVAEIEQLSDPNVGEASEVVLDDREGRLVVYNGEENGNPVRRMQVWSLANDRAYVITYTARSESYSRYLPIANEIIESFKITN